ncbi:helix-turn-helix transcriptional regulator [Polaromonas naphthalenivorans]|uniref:helix-turn-helix transcriptional regulator n=1 Tax=Polaromonas naphthalenivorans TaxID=216465 RepID=UPI00059DAEF1|nr:AlpA family phage regulatory protein [Polaromonas naphthalenivorans]
MSQRVIRLAQLASLNDRPGLLPVSPATIWRWVRQNKFPKPFKLAAGTTVWDAGQVEAFIAAQQAGSTQ